MVGGVVTVIGEGHKEETYTVAHTDTRNDTYTTEGKRLPDRGT